MNKEKYESLINKLDNLTGEQAAAGNIRIMLEDKLKGGSNY